MLYSPEVAEGRKIWMGGGALLYNNIFLLLSKALFQTYWRTAIRWGWSENLLGQAVVWNTAGVGARTAVPWHGNMENCFYTSLRSVDLETKLWSRNFTHKTNRRFFFYPDDSEILETWISISSCNFKYFRVLRIEKQIRWFILRRLYGSTILFPDLLTFSRFSISTYVLFFMIDKSKFKFQVFWVVRIEKQIRWFIFGSL